ncbi:capsular polysaccharide synthesis protein [Leuconostoc fallax]|uniref:capsular polysaccharide synthesis protein n=1 Tax=Leuconostoc fallax TaxID=1251 RepID=UPI002090BBD0|nr:capsular polysaccharide synthesis protein [Leuconostoc fallax]MCO6183165.1 capsular polysaccharide synthesis protein [Leuconostoc fallax]
MDLIRNLALYKIKGMSRFYTDPQKYREQKVRDFLFDKLSLKIKNKKGDTSPNSNSKIPVWIFWSQGFDNAPLFIRKNLNHTKQILSSNYVIHALDLSQLLSLIDIPDYILNKYYAGKIKQAFFSDLVRFYLLDKFGGLWLDSTVYITQSEIPVDIKNVPHFIFQDINFNVDSENERLTHIPGSNWLIYSQKGDYWTTLVRELLTSYWKNFNTFSYYYTTHLIMGLVFDANPDWYKKMPKYNNDLPHLVQHIMSAPYNEESIVNALSSSFAHKLSYKQIYYSEIDKQLFMNKLFGISKGDEEVL